MDECYVHAYPVYDASTASVSETPSCPKDQFFNVNFEIVKEYVVSVRKFHFNSETTPHSFLNVSKDEMMQESTILSWISQMGVPQESHEEVVTNVLDCARRMVNGCRMKVLSMRVVVVITQVGEDYESSEESEEEDENDDDGFVEEEVEEYSEEDNNDELVPASEDSIEGLEKVGNERQGCVKGSCAICFEDLIVGVQMPCFHMFHRNCIVGWLKKANSCPLCRFQMPTKKTTESC